MASSATSTSKTLVLSAFTTLAGPFVRRSVEQLIEYRPGEQRRMPPPAVEDRDHNRFVRPPKRLDDRTTTSAVMNGLSTRHRRIASCLGLPATPL